MDITYAQFKDKIGFLNQIDVRIDDKLSYAIKKVYNNMRKSVKSLEEDLKEELESEIDQIELKHALTEKLSDGKEALVYEDVQIPNGVKRLLRFSPENKIKSNNLIRQKVKEINNKYDERTISFSPYFCPSDVERIKDLDPEIIEELTGILFEN